VRWRILQGQSEKGGGKKIKTSASNDLIKVCDESPKPARSKEGEPKEKNLHKSLKRKRRDVVSTRENRREKSLRPYKQALFLIGPGGEKGEIPYPTNGTQKAA